ncbi:allantoinase AllB [Kaistia dalseonensis]|uniref:allantoinase n=1 Tax=Kaistia dalseonensis TaxID=410840 RepID=A0ABU0HAG1_9HYPH|nr:allantoinase AllB [Kaistia dalseonensis]MCX5496151.1 allantoinase AllB [Kaistia dalseonensis]MDQ0438760.1 dihydroorotase [Kaistia dalseonensis]
MPIMPGHDATQPEPVDIVLADGRIVNENGTIAASIAISGGKIVAIGEDRLMPPARERISVAGKHILPGAIDVHVHFRDPGMPHKEDWATGSAAAAVGGVTTVFDMPNTLPPTDTLESFQLKLAAAKSKSIVDFGLYGLLGEHNLGQLPELAEAGAMGFKLFLGNTTGDLPCPSDGAVLEGFEILAELGLRCSIHAENSPILFWRQNKLKAAGRDDVLAHLAARTDVVAVEALNRACTLAEWTGARIHIVHESSARSIPFIRFWKERGVDLTVETLPQYLYLSAEEMLEPGGEVLRMNPPIREKAQQEPLWQALVDGTIDMISTDHAPHAIDEKYGPRVWDLACGFPGVETSMALMLTAVAKGRMSLERYVAIASSAPARAFGLYGRKGVIRPGADADLAIVDLDKRATLSAAALHSRGKVSAYEGMAVKGVPVMTFVRGRLVAQDGEVVAAPGWGELVRPQMAAPAPRNLNTTMKAILKPGQQPWG